MNQGIDYMYDDGLSDEGFMRASKQLAPLFSELGDPIDDGGSTVQGALDALQTHLQVEDEMKASEEEFDTEECSTAEGAMKALDMFLDADERHGGLLPRLGGAYE